VPASRDDPRPRLRPPQFGLRTLLLAVTACGVLLAVANWLAWQPIVLAAIALFAASIFCHVAGNAIGTRLRQIGDQARNGPTEAVAAVVRPLRPQDYAPATKLGQRSSLGWTIVVATLAGTIIGGIGGGVWTLLASRGPVGAANIGVGVVAFAVLGGIAAFATVGFTQVLVSAIWQALKSPAAAPRRPEP
jgi:hypothetical protein